MRGCFSSGLSNGRAEGLNGKARVITRRAYGFHAAGSFISLLFLCCSLPKLSPLRTFPAVHPLAC
jgi:transposase